MKFRLPRLYAIVDASLLASGASALDIAQFAYELVEGGAELIQYRDKKGDPATQLTQAREIARKLMSLEKKTMLIMNNRADISLAAGFDGVHLGQEDLSVSGARRICHPPRIVGVSTHNVEQVLAADKTSADYIAIGPVFATKSKGNPDPVVGIEGMMAARKLTNKPLVAIGGITRANCRDVIAAGADSVALISDLLREPRMAAQEFVQLLA